MIITKMRPDDYGLFLEDNSCGTMWWYTGDPDNPDSSTINVKITNPYTDYLTKKQSDEIYYKDVTAMLLGTVAGLGGADILAGLVYYYLLKRQGNTQEVVYTDFHGRYRPPTLGDRAMLIQSGAGVPNECVVFYRINKGKKGRNGQRL